MHEITHTFVHSFGLQRDEGKRFALYGIGNNTRILLEELKGFSITCLMDAQNEGKRLYGQEVVSVEQAAGLADIVVIVARESVVPLIYERIKQLEDKNIVIYNVSGEKLQGREKRDFAVDERLKDCKLTRFIEKINTHDIISFDIFDTLIMRTTAFPRDVFSIVEKKLEEAGTGIENFSVLRMEAERLAGREKVPTYHDIYEEFAGLSGLDADCVEQVKQMEIETERGLLIRREEMCKLLGYARGVGKRVILVSDMYYGMDILTSFLIDLQVEHYDKLYVSCEQQGRKRDRLFEIVRENEQGSILHIGDSPDDETGERYDIDCLRIYSAVDMLSMSPLRDMEKFFGPVETNLLMGNWLGRLYNSPFAFADSSHVMMKETEMLAALLLGPLCLCFEDWLCKNIEGENGRECILFSARDGYLWKRIYEADEKLGHKPEGKYLFTSRTAAAAIYFSSSKQMKDVLEKPYQGTREELLWDRFGFAAKGEFEEKQLREHVDRNMEAFQSYFYDENFAGSYEKFYLVDFVAAGSVQHFLEEALGCRMEGLYFAQMEKENDWNMKVRSLLGKYNNYRPAYFMQKYHLLLEALILCPCGTCIGYDKKEKFRFREDGRSSRSIAALMELQEYSLAFFKKVRSICKSLDFSGTVSYLDHCFRLICEGRIGLSEELFTLFELENGYDGEKRQNSFEMYGLLEDK